MKRQLHELTSDELMVLLEQRQDDYADAHEEASRERTRQEALEAAIYKALKNTGKLSIEDAKAEMKASEERLEGAEQLNKAENILLRKKMALERVKVGIELWRSERADRRML